MIFDALIIALLFFCAWFMTEIAHIIVQHPYICGAFLLTSTAVYFMSGVGDDRGGI